jgi:hypothetical protein
MAANDYSHMNTNRGKTSDSNIDVDYTAKMAYAQDTRNWFKRTRGEWPEVEAPLSLEWVDSQASKMHTTITVVDGADGLTPDMLRVRKTPPVINHNMQDGVWPRFTHINRGTLWTHYLTEHGDNWRNDGPV